MNNLDFSCEPVELTDLKKFEKVLIQCVKAFQTITKMKTVSGERLPSSHRISKVHGSTFHLPLPLEETLKNFLHTQSPYQLTVGLSRLID